jgi:putative endopeptidase
MRGMQQIVSAALGVAMALAAAMTVADMKPDSGLDLAGIDHSVKPGDEFDGYASGAWRKAAVIPEVFARTEKRNAELIRDLGQSNAAAGTDARRVVDYYAAFMDDATPEKNGLAPLQPSPDARVRIW